MKMFLLFSHNMTDEQKEDAKIEFGVEEFVSLPKDLQDIWSNVPPHLESLYDYLEPIRIYLLDNKKRKDILLIQGDFGATCEMALFAKHMDWEAVYATTERNVEEKEINGKIIKTSIFKHVRFRKF
jgi:hypothetical protein